MASNESFKQAIKAYLDKRAEEDSLFAPKYANEKKSIDECCSYIMGEARKRGNAVAISDEEVYGMAVHYYLNLSIIQSRIQSNVDFHCK